MEKIKNLLKNKRKEILIIASVIIIITLFFSGYSLGKEYSSTFIETHAKEENIEYTGKIENLAFNTLMSFPEKALNNNNISTIYDTTKLTTFEFKNILNELYLNNYIIVDIYDIIDKDTLELKPILLPRPGYRGTPCIR